MSGGMWTEYRLPRTVYFQCVWLVKDMDRLGGIAMRADREADIRGNEIVLYVDETDGLLTDGVVREARRRMDCIGRAIEFVPEEYRDGIIHNIKDMEEPGDTACLNTWKYWKKRFIYRLARELDLY